MDELANLAAIELLEEVEMDAQNQIRFHHYDDAFDMLNDVQFVRMFRLTKNLAEEVIRIVNPYLSVQSRSSALDPSRKVLTALRFFASGSYQMDIGSNINMAVSQASVSRCIKEVTDALNEPEVLNEFVQFPRNLQELEIIRNENHGFPGVIGCIDCTHVAIYPPKTDDVEFPERIYVNRKGYHSMNVQLICDTNLKIINVCSRFPGGTHDSRIWNHSPGLPVVRNVYLNGNHSFYLLGDSGYALRPWLLTPIGNAPLNTPEAEYNQAHSRTRSIIERCNGVLKMRFRCLLKHRVLHYTPQRAAKIINSCVILHNLCIDHNIPDVEDEDDPVDDLDLGIYDDEENEQIVAANNRINPELQEGRRIQQRIVRNYFT